MSCPSSGSGYSSESSANRYQSVRQVGTGDFSLPQHQGTHFIYVQLFLFASVSLFFNLFFPTSLLSYS